MTAYALDKKEDINLDLAINTIDYLFAEQRQLLAPIKEIIKSADSPHPEESTIKSVSAKLNTIWFNKVRLLLLERVGADKAKEFKTLKMEEINSLGDLNQQLYKYGGFLEELKTDLKILKKEISSRCPSKEGHLVFGEIKLDVAKTTIQYKDFGPKDIAGKINNIPFKFLRLLLEKDGAEATPSNIAKSIYEGQALSDEEVRGKIPQVKQQLGTELSELGYPQNYVDEIKKMIKAISRSGYKLIPPA